MFRDDAVLCALVYMLCYIAHLHKLLPVGLRVGLCMRAYAVFAWLHDDGYGSGRADIAICGGA